MSVCSRILVTVSIQISGLVLFGACDDGGGDIPGDGAGEHQAARWLAFDSDRGTFNRDIYLVRGDGAQLTRLMTDPTIEKEPAFSHNGKSLAFVSDRSGSMQIHVMDLASGETRQLTSLDGGADQPSWSNDDSRIVFHGGPSIYVMAADGSNQEALVSDIDQVRVRAYPVFSLDDKEVIFSRDFEIDARNIATRSTRFVVPNSMGLVETPALSPDGRTLAFGLDCGPVETIAVTPLSGLGGFSCEARRVTPLAAGDSRRPSWATNELLAFERSAASDATLTSAVISVTEGPDHQPRDLVGLPGDNRNPSWAPVGFEPHR